MEDGNPKYRIKQAIKKKDIDQLITLCDTEIDSILGFKDRLGKRMIHIAVELESVELFQKLLRIGADPKICSGSYFHNGIRKTVLHLASEKGNLELLSFILQEIQDNDFRKMHAFKNKGTRKPYRNVFYYASKSGKKEVVECLQAVGLDINEVLPSGKTALLHLVEDFDSKGIELLCQCGANINTGTLNGNISAIQYASKTTECPETLNVLIQYGQDVNSVFVKKSKSRKTVIQESPLFVALKQGFTENARVLLENGANIDFNCTTPNIGNESCFFLAAKKCPDLVPGFLKKGANPNETYRGESVLMAVIAEQNSFMRRSIQALIQEGADVNFKLRGKTVIQKCQDYYSLEAFISSGVSVKDIEEVHKVSTLALAFKEDPNKIDTSTIIELLNNGANPNAIPEGEDSALIMACKHGMVEIAKELILRGANVDNRGLDGNTALHVCCSEDNLTDNSPKLIDLLLKHYPDIKIQNEEGQTVVDQAFDLYLENAYYEYSITTEILSRIINLAEVEEFDEKYTTQALRIAAEFGDFPLMTDLVLKGANIKDLDEEQRTILHICWNSSFDAVSALKFLETFVEKGGLLTTLDKEKQSPLEALLHQYYDDYQDETIAKIVQFFANHNAITESLLFLATKKGLALTVDVLLKSGIDPLARNEEGKTALHVCLEYPPTNLLEFVEKLMGDATAESFHSIFGDDLLCLAIRNIKKANLEDVVRLLLQRGVDPNRYQKNRVPFLEAIQPGNANILKCLLDANVNVHVTDEGGHNALHKLYQRYGNPKDILKILLSNKFNVNSVDDKDFTPLMMAVQKFSKWFRTDEDSFDIEDLINNGADVNIINKENMSALDICFKNGNSLDLGRLLLKYGARPKRSFYFAINNQQLKYCDEFEDFLMELLMKGADPNEHDTKSSNLIETVKRKMFKASEALIQHGAEVNKTDDDNQTALLHACSFDNVKQRSDFTKLLIKNGGDINKESTRGQNSLYVLVKSIIRDIGRYELSKLDDLVIKIDLEVFKLLVQGGAMLTPVETDQNINSMKSVLYQLITNGLFEMATFLIKAGWNITKETWMKDFDILTLDLETIEISHTLWKRVGIDKMKENFKSFIDSLDRGPRPLKVACRDGIRNQLRHVSRGREILSAIEKLSLPIENPQLPTELISFLKFSERGWIQKEELIQVEWREGPTYVYDDSDDFLSEDSDNF